MSRVEDLLRDTLSAVAADGAQPIGLADAAIAGATRVRRRRRMVAAGGLVVALLLGTVAAVQLGTRHGGPAGSVDGPVLLDAYGATALRTADGHRIGFAPDGRPTGWVSRVAGGWLVQGGVVYFLTDDGTRQTVFDPGAVPGLISWMVHVGTDRVAVQAETATENLLTVSSLPSGEVLATSTIGPGGAVAPIVLGFAGPDVVLASRAPRGAELTDVWDPTSGPYRGTPATRRTWLLPEGATTADTLALEPGPDPDVPCLARLDRARGYAPTDLACDLGLRWDDHVVLSPDGARLLVARADRWSVLPVGEALDGERPDPVVLPPADLFDGTWQGDVWWESRDTVLLSRDLFLTELVRCRLTDAVCAKVPTPEVDGAPAMGLVRWTPAG